MFESDKVSILKMKQQQHDINLRRTRKKKSESQMGFEPTTLVGWPHLGHA